ncbi:nitroreductase family protein [Perkinsela sp. CCAP 1560/4]|nr:nitroreductase family protein [Perkinsela sp. CCAP 1560/4]|eukprot:KNH03859.1 nitroreductase family protein [Perkinsela sp. CCAP 1560/4]
MTSPYQRILQMGILAVADNPRRVVAFRRTYFHPKTNQHVTLQPIPQVARPQFWREAYDGLHKQFDRVLFQDGHQPANTPGDPLRLLFRKVFPFILHRQYLCQKDMQAYIGREDADRRETHMALYSTTKELDPPVDPRARKAVELLQTIDPNLHVVMPWGFTHMPYLQWKLKQLGYFEKSCSPTTVSLQSEALLTAGLSVFFLIILPLYVLFRVLF